MKASASKRGLLSVCQWWAREDVTYEESKPGSSAILGTKFHAVAAAVINRDEDALAALPMPKPLKDAWTHAEKWVSTSRTPSMVAEVAFAFDFVTGKTRYHGPQNGRDYSWANPNEFCGTLDILDTSNDVAYVYDWKTGRSVDHVWPQMRVLGSMAGNTLRKERVSLQVLHATREALDRYVGHLDDMDIAGELELLRRDLSMVGAAKPEPGSHCDAHWCGARSVCGAYRDWSGS